MNFLRFLSCSRTQFDKKLAKLPVFALTHIKHPIYLASIKPKINRIPDGFLQPITDKCSDGFYSVQISDSMALCLPKIDSCPVSEDFYWVIPKQYHNFLIGQTISKNEIELRIEKARRLKNISEIFDWKPRQEIVDIVLTALLANKIKFEFN